MKNVNDIIWDASLLLIRIWLGRTMILGGQSVLRFFSSQELRDFFENWFGNEMGFPAPLVMAFLAKGTEFVGGILLCLGLFSRVSAAFVGFVMLVATFAANLNFSGTGEILLPDGRVTISSFLFALIVLQQGAGRFSLDALVFRKKYRLI